MSSGVVPNTMPRLHGSSSCEISGESPSVESANCSSDDILRSCLVELSSMESKLSQSSRTSLQLSSDLVTLESERLDNINVDSTIQKEQKQNKSY